MPDSYTVILPIVGVVSMLAMVAAILWLYRALYHHLESGQALVVNKLASVEVFFTGGLVVPVVHRAEVIDIRSHRLVLSRCGKDGLVCRDNVRADVEAVFFVAVNRTSEDVIKVAQKIGCARAGDPEALGELFRGKFLMALAEVARQFDFEDLLTKMETYREQVIEVVGRDLDGFVLEDVVLERVGQTPRASLDPDNVFDAKGLRKIVTIASEQKVLRFESEQRAERELRKQQAELEALVIELERVKKDALATFRKATGQDLSEEKLQARIDAHLGGMVRPVVDEAVQAAVAQKLEDVVGPAVARALAKREAAEAPRPSLVADH